VRRRIFERTILPIAMTLVEFWIIEDRVWWGLSGWGLAQDLCVLFQQGIDHTVSRSFPFQSKEGPFRLFHPTFVLPPLTVVKRRVHYLEFGKARPYDSIKKASTSAHLAKWIAESCWPPGKFV
jgi:hypothetical protein